MVAADGGTPPQTAMTVVNVHVNRNQFPPRFETESYTPKILEIQSLGVPFIRAQAKDQDSKVSMLAVLAGVYCCSFILEAVFIFQGVQALML